MNTWRACVLAALATWLVVMVACSGGADDDGTGDAMVEHRDAALFEGNINYDEPCDLGDGGVAPQGTHLITSPKVGLLGVTTDDNAVVYDRKFSQIYIQPLAGGVPEQLGPSYDNTSTVVSIWDGIVDYWTGITNFSQYPYTGQLVEWSATGHGKVLAASSFPGLFAASKDGKYVIYSANASASFAQPDAGVGTGTTDVMIANGDGSNATKVATIPWTVDCIPSMKFIGDVAITASCSAGPSDAGGPIATIHAYRSPSWQSSVLNTNTYTSIGGNDTELIYFTAGSELVLQNVAASGGPVPIASQVASASLANNGTSVFYMLGSGAVLKSPVTASSPSLVSLSTFDPNVGLYGLSPDDKWLIVAHNLDNTTGLSDLYLLSTAGITNGTALVTTKTAAFTGSFFTADSTYAMFGANVVPAPYGFYGDIAVAPVSNAIDVTTLAHLNWSGFASTGSKIVFNDDYDLVYPALPTADIHTVDLATTTPPKTLVSHADADFYLTADHKNVVYTWTYCATSAAGLYVVPIP